MIVSVTQWRHEHSASLFACNRKSRPGNPPGCRTGLLAQDQVELSGVVLRVPHIVEEQFGDTQVEPREAANFACRLLRQMNDHGAALSSTMR
jgi:hypothetical protein